MKEISIVIPVYNSEACVLELARQIAESLDGTDYEQILVNDCSRDGSWNKICEAVEKGFPVTGINLRKNSGQDNAILAGLMHAHGRYIVIMDDDLQHSPSDIPKLKAKAQEGYDVVYANFPQKKQKLWKNIGSYLNGKCSELLIQKPKGLYLSPFKIIKNEVAQEITRTGSLYPYIDGLIFQVTKNITQISVEHHRRETGQSNYTFRRSVKVFAKLLFGFSVLPLRISSVVGALSSLAGFSLGIYYIALYLFGKADVTGWTTLVVLVLFIGGLILLSLGIIGEYLGRTYLTINKCPRFVVSEIRRKNEEN